MKRFGFVIALGLTLSACASTPSTRAVHSASTQIPAAAASPTVVQILAINDFHGNLEAPRIALPMPDGRGGTISVPAGGAANLAGAIEALRQGNPNTVTVSAGDMISASPLTSALFLDEPTILAMNRIGVSFNAVGNHEFDRGRNELLRMQRGGCEKNTSREPCQVDRDFPGARFGFLAANVVTENGQTLFPATGLSRFGEGAHAVAVGFIGMTLRGTPSVVSPASVVGLNFRDEAETANALIPELKRQGADAIVVLIHQGSAQSGAFNPNGCDGLTGELNEILDRLDPAVDVVVSGHTHQAYICNYQAPGRERPLLVTSAGQYGTMVSNITLSIDPGQNRVITATAQNTVVQGDGFTRGTTTVATTDAFPRYPVDQDVATLVSRYATAAQASANRTAGRMTGPAPRATSLASESVLGNLIADAQLAATRAPERGGAQIAFMNAGGIRESLTPAADGSITYGQLFSVQPFNNSLVVKTLTGMQIRRLLEQQWEGPVQRFLSVSDGFRFRYDDTKPVDQRIVDVTFNGQPLSPERTYRVTMNSFLAGGGDGFSVFAEGTDVQVSGQDVDALEAYLSTSAPVTPPATDRIMKR